MSGQNEMLQCFPNRFHQGNLHSMCVCVCMRVYVRAPVCVISSSFLIRMQTHSVHFCRLLTNYPSDLNPLYLSNSSMYVHTPDFRSLAASNSIVMCTHLSVSRVLDFRSLAAPNSIVMQSSLFQPPIFINDSRIIVPHTNCN